MTFAKGKSRGDMIKCKRYNRLRVGKFMHGFLGLKYVMREDYLGRRYHLLYTPALCFVLPYRAVPEPVDRVL